MSKQDQQLKTLVHLAIPAVLSQLAQMGMGFIDVIMAGHHSKETLAAISVGSNLFYPLIIFFLGIFLSINPLTAQAQAQENHIKLAQLLKTGLLLSIVLSLPLLWALNHLSPVIALLKLTDQISNDADAYLGALAYGLIPLFMFFVLRFFNEGLFQTRPIMIIALSALPLNVLLNYLFLFVFDMGSVGLGYATSIAHSYLFIALLLFTFKNKGFRKIQRNFTRVASDLQLGKKMIRLGAPIGVGLGLEICLFSGVGLLIAQYGTEMVAGHQIAMNFASMAFMIPMGISIATTARVGFYYGLNDYATAKKIGIIGVLLSAAVMSFSAFTMWIIPEQIVGLYTQDPATVAIAVQLLFFAAIFQLFDGIQVALTGALRGLQDTKVPMYISIVAYWFVGFPVGFFMAKTYQASGFWLGIIAALFVAALLLSIRFYRITHSKLHF